MFELAFAIRSFSQDERMKPAFPEDTYPGPDGPVHVSSTTARKLFFLRFSPPFIGRIPCLAWRLYPRRAKSRRPFSIQLLKKYTAIFMPKNAFRMGTHNPFIINMIKFFVRSNSSLQSKNVDAIHIFGLCPARLLSNLARVGRPSLKDGPHPQGCPG